MKNVLVKLVRTSSSKDLRGRRAKGRDAADAGVYEDSIELAPALGDLREHALHLRIVVAVRAQRDNPVPKKVSSLAELCLENGWDALFASAKASGQGTPQLFDALVDSYLSLEHRDHPEEGGCLFAALSTEIARSDDEVRAAATKKLETVLGKLAAVFDDRRAPAARAAAIFTYAALVGAISLARTTNDADLSKEILSAVAKGLKKLARPEASRT